MRIKKHPPLTFLFSMLIYLLSSLQSLYATDSAIIVFDASSSMWGQIEGKNKITIAREVMGEVIKDWNKDIELGLVAYGHREKGNCDDIEVLLPVAKLNSKKILTIINNITPKGKTPISASLKKAAKILRYEEDPATIILISDGKENCDADPCVIAQELEDKGINFTTHVIGFDIKKNKKAREQLKCIAKNTGGQFFEAKDAVSLKEAFVKVEEEIIDPRPTKCKQYAENAVEHERTNIESECGYESKHWTTDYATHFDWCMTEAMTSILPMQEHDKRTSKLKKCHAPQD
jgi:Ca-activated chloride channel family protein